VQDNAIKGTRLLIDNANRLKLVVLSFKSDTGLLLLGSVVKSPVTL
jgi:hypothetical protein